MKLQTKKQFTLIEMLVVIAIIFILAGLVFPAVNAVRLKAKQSKAHTECNTLKTAIINYEAEYACWPAATSGNSDTIVDSSKYIEMCKNLIGRNTKKLVFFEPAADYNESKGFLDPWGNIYQVVLDVNFDNKLDNATLKKAAQLGTNGADQYLHQRVAVFSYGIENGASGQIEEYIRKGRLISSWK